jgi:hypothetical protein
MDPHSLMRVACAAGKDTKILIDDAKRRYEELRPNVRDALTRISRAYFRFRHRFNNYSLEHDIERSLSLDEKIRLFWVNVGLAHAEDRWEPCESKHAKLGDRVTMPDLGEFSSGYIHLDKDLKIKITINECNKEISITLLIGTDEFMWVHYYFHGLISLPRPIFFELPREKRSILEHALSSPVPYDEDTLILSRGNADGWLRAKKQVQAHEKKIEKARDELKNITDYMEYMIHTFQDTLAEIWEENMIAA